MKWSIISRKKHIAYTLTPVHATAEELQLKGLNLEDCLFQIAIVLSLVCVQLQIE